MLLGKFPLMRDVFFINKSRNKIRLLHWQCHQRIFKPIMTMSRLKSFHIICFLKTFTLSSGTIIYIQKTIIITPVANLLHINK